MAKWESQEVRKIAVTTASKQEDFLAGCVGCYLIADADCFVDFDRTAVVNSSLFIKANIPTSWIPVPFTKINAVCASTANLYILAVRSNIS